MAVLAKRNGENIAAKKLGGSMKTVDKKIRNLMNAIEECIGYDLSQFTTKKQECFGTPVFCDLM